MKLTLLAALTFLPCLALAQSTTDTTPASSTPPASGTGHHHWLTPEQQLAWLTTKLTLTDTEQGQVKPLLVSRDEQLKAIHENTSLTEDQKHEQMKALFESTNKQIEAFLTPAQVTLFEAMHQHHA